MKPKSSASKGLAGPGLWSGVPWLWIVVLSPGRRDWGGVWKVAIMMTPGNCGAAFSAQMWTGDCWGLFSYERSVEGAGCLHRKCEFSGTAFGHFVPSDKVLLPALPPFPGPLLDTEHQQRPGACRLEGNRGGQPWKQVLQRATLQGTLQEKASSAGSRPENTVPDVGGLYPPPPPPTWHVYTLYWFLRTAVTTYYRHSDVPQICYLLALEVRSPKWVLQG